MLRYTEKEAWHKTPWQIITLFKLHKEYNQPIFPENEEATQKKKTNDMDDIDVALGGL